MTSVHGIGIHNAHGLGAECVKVGQGVVNGRFELKVTNAAHCTNGRFG